MFRGLYEHSVDPKGRTSLPAKFREALSGFPDNGQGPVTDRVMLTTGIDRCLVAYPLSEWHALESKLAKLPQFDPAVVQLKRLYIAGASECPIDRHGRLLIPPMLREYADLKHDLVWAGMVNSIEVWAKELWLAQQGVTRADPKAISRAIAELGL